MSWDTTTLTAVFKPLLKTREQIQVSVDFVLRCRGISEFLRFMIDTDGTAKEVEQQVHADAESIVNQWALQFPSAEEALDRSAYESIVKELGHIRPSTCMLVAVIARSIVPLSERSKEEPKQVIEEKKPLTDQLKETLNQRVATARMVKEFEQAIPYEEIATDPDEQKSYRSFLQGLRKRVMREGRTAL